jgi:uncharacterized membrane protein (Fun14 family)
LFEDDTFDLLAGKGENLPGVSYTWSISPSYVADLILSDELGTVAKVVALNWGVATITIRSSTGVISVVSLQIQTPEEGASNAAVRLNVHGIVEMPEAAVMILTPILGLNVDPEDLIWISGDPEIVTIEELPEEGDDLYAEMLELGVKKPSKLVRAVGHGKVVVTVQTPSGDKSAVTIVIPE